MTAATARTVTLDRAALRTMFAQPRLASGKVMRLEDAIAAFVEPGMTLHFAYSEGRPIAAGIVFYFRKKRWL